MSRLRPSLPGRLMVTALALWICAGGIAGCRKTKQAEKEAAAKAAAEAQRVAPEDARRAGEALREAWAGLEVEPFAPETEEQERFYRHLMALTRWPHRLCGLGKVRITVRNAEGEVVRTREADELVSAPAVEVSEGETAKTDIIDAPGSLAAAKYVEQALKAAGVDELYLQEFSVVQPVTTECRLFLNGQEVSGQDVYGDPSRPVLYACRPNILWAPITPAEGLTGRAIYVGDGDLSDYPEFPEGKIVLMDFDCGVNWKTAFALGARAVVFVGAPDAAPASLPYQHLNMPANLPRFYVTAEVADKLDLRTPKQMTLKAACDWQPKLGRNVIGVLRGVDPRFGEGEKRLTSSPQAIVLAAPLDSLSEVPALSPGARDAANCATLLTVAEHLAKDRPRRDVVLCFFDGQAQNHLGARAFYGALFRSEKLVKADHTGEELLQAYKQERDFHHRVLALVSRLRQRIDLQQRAADLQAAAKPIPADLTQQINSLATFSPQTSAALGRQFDSCVEVLRNEAEFKSGQVLDALRPLRLRRADLQQDLKRAKKLIEDTAPKRRAELQEQGNEEGLEALEEELEEANARTREIPQEIAPLNEKISELEVLDLAWNTIQRFLHEQKPENDIDDPQMLEREMFDNIDDPENRARLVEKTPVMFRELVRHTHSLLSRRLRELAEADRQVKQGLTLRDAIGPGTHNLLLHISVNLGDARPRWTFIHGDDTVPMGTDKTGNYRSLFTSLEEMAQTGPLSDAAPGFDVAPIGLTYNNRVFAPAKIADSAGIARTFGVLNVSVMTVMDPMDRQGQPADTLAALNVKTVLTQAEQAAPFLKQLGDSAKVSNLTSKVTPDARYLEPKWEGIRSSGISVKRKGGGSAMADTPVRNAVVAFTPKGKTGPWDAGELQKVPPGFVVPIVVRANANGDLTVPVHSQSYFKTPLLFAASFDRSAESDDQPESVKEDVRTRGVVTAVTATDSLVGSDLAKTAIVQFKCRSKSLVGYGYGRGAIQTIVMRALSTAKFLDDRYLQCEQGEVISVYAPYDAEGLKLVNKAGMFVLNNDDTPEGYKGRGISLLDEFEHPVVPAITAANARDLNRHRLRLLRDNRINQETLEELGGSASDLLQDATRVAVVRDREWADPRADSRFQVADASILLTGDRLLPEGSSELMVVKERLRAEDGKFTGEIVVERGYDGTVAEPLRHGQKLRVLRYPGVLPQDLIDKCIGDLTASAEYSRCVYTPLVSVMNDLVTAVVLLLLLAMPFAYALERLLIGTPHIYRQIGWFAVFFVLTFAVLYLVNPAFKIASTPMIIFLAFAIILLSCLVIFIMVRKLQTEIKKMQGLATTVHSADVSRLSTMMAAVNMGISTMRRRPLRTVLTATTVVLLTFTILTFASFGSSWGARETNEGAMTSKTPRIVIRHQLRSPIARGIFDCLRGHFRGEAEVVPRYWVSPTATEAKEAQQSDVPLEMLLSNKAGTARVTVQAALGLDPRDVDRQPELRDLFVVRATPEEQEQGLTKVQIIRKRLENGGVFMTEAVAGGELKLTADDINTPLLLADQKLKFAGILDDRLVGHTMLEGSSILPVDYQASAGGTDQGFDDTSADESLLEQPDIESAQFSYYDVHSVVIVPPAVARNMGDRLRAITLYPDDPASIDEIGRRAAKICKLPTYVGGRGQVNRMMFTSLTKASGWRDLLIPVVLGGMIVFATLLGSVSDREREIYTFSSLGLAPPHVAGLFFAEAAVYAVVGGMGGYLLGQIVARVLGWLATMGLVSIPTMNYSSTNAIVTILIVMCTVLISTIYPAVKASKSANPGVQRTWKIPKPEGNLYDLVFPFTVSTYDITGVVSFLREHFDNFRDASLGVFATTHCEIFRQKDNDMLGFEATVALAPFDLGVNQRFGLLSQSSEIEGIDEVRILIYRLSGANGDWRRSNRVFINDLRKQLLIWRSLPDEVMDKYRQTTLDGWNQLPVRQLDDQTIAADAGSDERADPKTPPPYRGTEREDSAT